MKKYFFRGSVIGSIVVLLAGLGFIGGLLKKELKSIQASHDKATTEYIKTNQFLLSTIDWTTKDKRMTLYMRDIIVAEWRRLGIKKPDFNVAYIKSEAILKECDRYPHVDAFALLAVQRVESSFLDTLTSIRHAKGSWQIVESTAKLLCQALGISYSKEMYWDPVVSTRLAGKYFDILFSSYTDTLAMFADYNGGPLQAGNYLYKKASLDKETRAFIKDVKAFMDTYRAGFAEYNPELSTDG